MAYIYIKLNWWGKKEIDFSFTRTNFPGGFSDKGEGLRIVIRIRDNGDGHQ